MKRGDLTQTFTLVKDMEKVPAEVVFLSSIQGHHMIRAWRRRATAQFSQKRTTKNKKKKKFSQKGQ